MSLSIAKDFRFFSLLRFALPTMIMMVFTSLYTIVDGIFISRFVGSNALSSANIVFPVINLIIAVGVMFASGGSALIAKKVGGTQRKNEAKPGPLIDYCGFFIFKRAYFGRRHLISGTFGTAARFNRYSGCRL